MGERWNSHRWCNTANKGALDSREKEVYRPGVRVASGGMLTGCGPELNPGKWTV